ncbi:MAG: CobD/CbiB family cobalamin biosynthesis protein, partial [Candidatus Hydrogenedentota bacterium]
MLSLYHQVLIALALDILLGDPEGFPHPVRLMGRAAKAIEAPLRRLIPAERFAGIVAALLICCGSAALVYGATELSAEFHPLLRDILSIYVMYSCIALRDMMRHSSAVHTALKQGDIAKARQQLSRIVGRDTEQLDGPGIVRAAVESVAESTVDGVLAPLFFCFL